MDVRNLLRTFAIATIAVAVAATITQTPAKADGGFSRQSATEVAGGRDGGEKESRALVPFARLTLPNGNGISFFEIAMEGKRSAFGVVESGLPGNPPSLARPELAGKNPMDVFHALASPDAPLPDRLASRYGLPSERTQGWLLGTTSAQSGFNVCSDSQFDALFDSLAAPIWDSRLVRLHERPIDHPSRWTSYTEHFGLPGPGFDAYRYKASRNDVELYYTMVGVCALDSHPQFCTNYGNCISHPGPEIAFKYVTSWGAVHGTAFITDVPANGVGSYYTWFFHTGSNWDWSTEIRLARAFDSFQIGLAWKD